MHHGSAGHSHHRDLQGGAARAAVFGISDGLLTNISLILGVAGANPLPSVVLLAGLAGLVAGAFSMAAGEYVSMAAQSELLQRELEIERRELERHPEAETSELAAVYRLRGVDDADARRIAEAIMKDPVVALEVHAREELGLRPGKTGNPWQAAGSSFVMFSIGAIIPLFPWFFVSGTTAALLSIVLGAISVLRGRLDCGDLHRPLARPFGAAPAGIRDGCCRSGVRGRPSGRQPGERANRLIHSCRIAQGKRKAGLE